jgi:hypothetical protein
VWFAFVFGCVGEIDPVAGEAMNSTPRKLSVITMLVRERNRSQGRPVTRLIRELGIKTN